MALTSEGAFQLLTFIAAPALLTNASSVLVLSTSNRFARAVDRARALEAMPDTPEHERALFRVARRALLLNRALTAFYVAVASFATGTFSELLGGGIATLVKAEIAPVITELGLFVATVGTIAIAAGATFLVRETWDAYAGLREEARDLLHGKMP
ncbi:MAG TPA: DUF2721 domain-containing protein [Candidatus Elarobacter sp.]|jgi:hypothetical protein|nr:DUF2721 domain-containing protein [Candidatus Elarobacter sp.]